MDGFVTKNRDDKIQLVDIRYLEKLNSIYHIEFYGKMFRALDFAPLFRIYIRSKILNNFRLLNNRWTFWIKFDCRKNFVLLVGHIIRSLSDKFRGRDLDSMVSEKCGEKV